MVVGSAPNSFKLLHSATEDILKSISNPLTTIIQQLTDSQIFVLFIMRIIFYEISSFIVCVLKHVSSLPFTNKEDVMTQKNENVTWKWKFLRNRSGISFSNYLFCLMQVKLWIYIFSEMSIKNQVDCLWFLKKMFSSLSFSEYFECNC